jgi:putative membrane protein
MKLLTSIAATLLSATVFAQASPPPADDAGPNPATKTTNPSPADANFVTQLAIGGLAEVSVGQVATSHAADKRVKDFGQQMVTDHSKANYRGTD